ncbi:PI-PLC X domain-containing protein 2-like [Bolinopsis microptera]|uniref:PI-PLC X domain-containing protein 2-like n=1 Tax=Bolinopsis microptera TaxID=2820187 RepID=UPI00307A6CC2
MNHIYKCADIQVFSMLKKIEEMFGDKLCPPPPENGSVTKYAEMIEAGKRVIVAFTERPNEFSSTYQPSDVRSNFKWIWTSETNVVSHWANTTNVDKLTKKLIEEGPPKSFQLHVTQTILTPRTKNVIHGLFWRPHNLKQMAQKLNRHLPNLFESGDLNVNIAIVDFLTPDLTTVLVNQNKVSC